MAKESKYSVDKRVVFRETFNSFQGMSDNGWYSIGAGLTINNGIISFSGASVQYCKNSTINVKKNTTYTVRMRFKTTINSTTYFFDARGVGETGVGFFYQEIGGYFIKSSGTVYIDGSSVSWGTIYDGKIHEVVVTGITLNLNEGYFVIGSTAANNFRYIGDYELVEIYSGTLTATEVSELYKGTLYTEPNLLSNTILDINPKLGNFNDKYNHTVTNTSVSLVKSGNVRVGGYNGTTSILTLADTDDLSFGDGAGNDRAFSIEAWARITRSSQTQVIVAKSVNYEYSLYKSVGNLMRLNLWSNNPAIYIGRHGSYNDDISNWKHIVGTYNGNKSSSGIKVYMNGVQIDTADDNNGVYVGMPNSTTNPIIGSSLTKGFIGRTRIFNKELSQSEITRLYNSQKGLYE